MFGVNVTIPNEGETLALNILLKRILTDRDADFEVGLYTNSGLTRETATEAALTEPSDGSYARKTLTDANWTVSGDQGTYADQDFIAVTTDMTGMQGAFVATKSAGGTQRILGIIAIPTAPLTLVVGETLRVALSATAA